MKKGRVFDVMIIVCLVVSGLTGCARSPGVAFYTLSAVAKPEPAAPAMSTPTVVVEPISLPDLVDRPQMVVRIDESRVDILETRRWAEPLKNAIPRLLAQNLSRRMGGARVSSYPQSAANEVDYRVVVDFLRFESTGDLVAIDALWSISRTNKGAPKTGRAEIREPNNNEGYDALVATYNRALFDLSSDIARAIQNDWVVAR